MKANELSTGTNCIDCHKGSATTYLLDEAISAIGVNDNDILDPALVFIDIGNTAAAATNLGTWGMAGYQYSGKNYDARFAHVEGFNTCTDCHDAHTLELQLHGCSKCHQGVDAPNDFDRIRAVISIRDYDGDGDILEGISQEVATLHATLYTAIQSYASDVAGTPIIFYASYPYFYIDTNGDGQPDPTEVVPDNHFRSWTPRLLQATYNYLYCVKDPAAYAHNSDYILQILYDSLVDLDVDTRNMVRP